MRRRRGRRNTLDLVPTGARGRPGTNDRLMWKLMAEKEYGSYVDAPVIATREALQNSRDAIDKAYWTRRLNKTAGRFETIIDPRADGPIAGGLNAIRWTDNGIGMDSHTFFTKFLYLAATTKKGGEGAGGFGVAKAIILGLSQSFRWTMWTRDRIYVADGFDTEVLEYEAPSYRAGTSLTVYDIDSRFADFRAEASGAYEPMATRIARLLASNNLRPQPRMTAGVVPPRQRGHAGVRLYLGERGAPTRQVAPLMRGSGILLIDNEETDRDVALTVRAYKRKRRGAYYVRIEGLTQFAHRMPEDTKIDLAADVSTTISPQEGGYPLTTSRMQLSGETRWVLSNLISEIREQARAGADDPRLDDYVDVTDLSSQIAAAELVMEQYQDLLEDPSFKQRMRLAVGGRALLHRFRAKYDEVRLRWRRLQEERRTAEIVQRADRALDDFYRDLPEEPSPPVRQRPPKPVTGLEALRSRRPKKRAKKPIWTSNPFAPLASVKIARASYNARRLRRFAANPKKWLDLALVWRFTCQMVLDELERPEAHDFKIGFMFDDRIRAAYTNENGVQTLWLNPAWFETVIKAYRDRPLNVAAVLHAKASHEVTHLLVGDRYHGDEFAVQRETVSDETIGILYPLSVLVQEMLGLKAAPLKRRRGRSMRLVK